MTFRVVLQRLAAAELQDDYDYAARHSPLDADRWLDRFSSLSPPWKSDPNVAALPVNTRRSAWSCANSCLGSVPACSASCSWAGGDKVRILRIRRAQRRPLSADDLREALSDESRMTSMAQAAGRIRPSAKTEAWGLSGAMNSLAISQAFPNYPPFF